MTLRLVSYDIILTILLLIGTTSYHVTAVGPTKIKIDSSTRLYVEEQTGRYRMFHGLALENSGSPWYYATYTTEQINLLKQVALVILVYCVVYSSLFFFHIVGSKCCS